MENKSRFNAMKNDLENPNLAPIPKDELDCRRAFEEFMRVMGKPGKLGFPDTDELKTLYRGWRACWLYMKEEDDPWVNK